MMYEEKKKKKESNFKNRLENIELKKEMRIYLKYELRIKKYFHIEEK